MLFCDRNLLIKLFRMKKFIYLFMFAVIGMTATVFISCSDDEETTQQTPAADEVIGTYGGELTISVSGSEMPPVSQDIEVTKASDNSVTVSLNDFSFMGMPIGDIELKDCQLVEDGDNYKFAGETSLQVDIIKADVDATGTIGSGKININMDITATLGTEEQVVNVVYTGEKK